MNYINTVNSNRNTGNDTIIFNDSKGIKSSYTLKNFALNTVNNYESENDNDLYNQQDKINCAAQKLYSQMNSEFNKNHVSLKDRFALWIYNIFSSENLAKKIGGILSSYLYNTKNIEIPFLSKEPSTSPLEIETTSPAPLLQDSPIVMNLDTTTDNPFLYSSFLRKKGVSEEEISQQRRSKKPESSFSKEPTPAISATKRWENPYSFANSLLLEKSEENLKQVYPDTYPKGSPIPKDKLVTYLNINPAYAEDRRNEVEQEIVKMMPGRRSASPTFSEPALSRSSSPTLPRFIF